jgi:phage recombination protein Bet
MLTEEKRVKRAIIPKVEKAVVTWQGRNITITFDDVKNRICPKAADQEIIVFLKMCQSLNLNPWEKDIFMVKYKEDEPASYIVATQAYLKSAEMCPEFDGCEAGVVLKDTTGKLEFREGSLILDIETSKLVGGWARVYRKDRRMPFFIAVNLTECQKYNREGKPTRFWAGMPATMVRKVALSRALREAFPSRLGGMVTEAEFEEETPEGQLPPALERNGKPDWRKFWAKVKSEFGLTTEQARELLQVDSIKEDLINAGCTMEQIWDKLTLALQLQQTADVKSEEEAIKEQPQASKRDPAVIKTINDLLKACHEEFNMQPKDIYMVLNVKSANEITELPSECYKKIAETRG